MIINCVPALSPVAVPPDAVTAAPRAVEVPMAAAPSADVATVAPTFGLPSPDLTVVNIICAAARVTTFCSLEMN